MTPPRAVVVPSMAKPNVGSAVVKKRAAAATFPAASAMFMAFLPGSASGLDASTPWSFPKATAEPVQDCLLWDLQVQPVSFWTACSSCASPQHHQESGCMVQIKCPCKHGEPSYGNGKTRLETAAYKTSFG